MLEHSLQKIARRVSLLRILVVLVAVTGTLIWLTSQRHDQRADIRQSEFSSEAKGGVFYPTAAQWATLTVEPVQQQVFRSEHVTEGKIAVDEDRSTPIFSPIPEGSLSCSSSPATPSPSGSRCSRSKPPTWCRRRTILSVPPPA
jgi:hypothetical protein